MRAPSVHCQARFLKVDIDNEQLQRTVMDHGITGVVGTRVEGCWVTKAAALTTAQ
jgi:hypothetical protein